MGAKSKDEITVPSKKQMMKMGRKIERVERVELMKVVRRRVKTIEFVETNKLVEHMTMAKLIVERGKAENVEHNKLKNIGRRRVEGSCGSQ